MNFKKQLRLVFEPVSMTDLIHSVCELLEMKAKLRKLKLLVEIDPDIPEYIETDPRRLKQILLNLTGNALKFTFEGHVKIKLDALPASD